MLPRFRAMALIIMSSFYLFACGEASSSSGGGKVLEGDGSGLGDAALPDGVLGEDGEADGSQGNEGPGESQADVSTGEGPGASGDVSQDGDADVSTGEGDASGGDAAGGELSWDTRDGHEDAQSGEDSQGGEEGAACDAMAYQVTNVSAIGSLSGRVLKISLENTSGFPLDELRLEFYGSENLPFGPGQYSFQGEDLENCSHCLSLYHFDDEPWDWEDPDRLYVAESGGLEIDQMSYGGWDFQGRLKNVVLREAEVTGPGMTTRFLPDGRSVCIDALEVKATVRQFIGLDSVYETSACKAAGTALGYVDGGEPIIELEADESRTYYGSITIVSETSPDASGRYDRMSFLLMRSYNEGEELPIGGDSFLTADQYIFIQEGCRAGIGSCEKSYVAASGTLRLLEYQGLGKPFSAELRNAVFKESHSHFGVDWVEDGKTWCVDHSFFNGVVTAYVPED